MHAVVCMYACSYAEATYIRAYKLILQSIAVKLIFYIMKKRKKKKRCRDEYKYDRKQAQKVARRTIILDTLSLSAYTCTGRERKYTKKRPHKLYYTFFFYSMNALLLSL